MALQHLAIPQGGHGDHAPAGWADPQGQLRMAAAPVASAPHWRLVWGVVALQVSLQLGWIVYQAYQPTLLRANGFAALLVPFTLLPGLLGLLSEPISGAFSDRWSAKARGRMLPITITVLVAGLIFLAVVGLLQGGRLTGSLLLPSLMLAWMVAVQASSSPSLAQLNEAVSLRNLPAAAALVTFAQGLVGAFSTNLSQAALRLGPTFTFLLGAGVLALGLAVLRATQRSPATSAPEPAMPLPAGRLRFRRPSLGRCALLLTTAMGAGGLVQALLVLLPRVHSLAAQGLLPIGTTSVVLLGSALAAPGAGRMVSRWGPSISLAVAAAALALSLALAMLLPSATAVPFLLLMGLLHSMLLTSLTATSLATLPLPWSGLGAGLVLGGSGAASSLFLLRFGSEGTVQVPGAGMAVLLSLALTLGGWLLLHQGARAAPPSAASVDSP